jgi:phosphotriesterase-related protein
MANHIQTVLGPVTSGKLGRVLPHEHIASVYGRWGQQLDVPNAEWKETVLAHYTPMLTRLREQYGCRTLVEVSPSWGFRQRRDLDVWVELSRRSGVNIVVATGFYVGEVRPPNFAALSANQLAEFMVREATDGIAGSSVRAGIIKVAVGSEFSAHDRRLCQAAALAQQATGLSITTHTCDPRVRRGVLDMLEGAGVPPERITLGHADTNATLPELLDLAQRGCNLLLTIWGIQDRQSIGWALPTLPRYHSPGLVAGLVAEGYGAQVLISIDYSAGFEDGRLVEDLYGVEGRTSLYMFTHALDDLRNMGVPDDALERILRDNPRRMLVPA